MRGPPVGDRRRGVRLPAKEERGEGKASARASLGHALGRVEGWRAGPEERAGLEKRKGNQAFGPREREERDFPFSFLFFCFLFIPKLFSHHFKTF